LPLIEISYAQELDAQVKQLAQSAFEEDLPDGDVTADVLELKAHQGKGEIICRQTIHACGARWYHHIADAFHRTFPNDPLEMTCHFEDGVAYPAQTTLFTLEGSVAAIVAIERVLLNFLGRGIGIANATAKFAAAVSRYNNHTRIYDTRKTIPGYRYFDKYAVLCGGGCNHRMNLSDQVLIKENHIAKLDGVKQALAYVRERLTKPVQIQIEVENLSQLKEALEAECPIIMLDNFSPAMVREACEMPRGNSQLEASGGMTLDNIAAYCHPRLDRISIGAITHSITAPDLSLLISEV
jgi:nicotinate-nucleotide pyrophosphorylase (carboxylating)